MAASYCEAGFADGYSCNLPEQLNFPSRRWWTESTVAVVTGGNKGVGFEIVKQLAQNQLTVILTGRNQELGLHATTTLKNQGLNVIFHPLDVLDPTSVSELADWLEQQYHGFDILINKAAIPDYELSFASANAVLETNYKAVKHVTKQLLPLLKPSDAGARIVNVSSLSGQLKCVKNSALRKDIGTLEGLTEEKVDRFVETFLQDVREQKAVKKGWPRSSFALSMVALNAYTRVLAESLKDRSAGKHIYVNCVDPGHLTRDKGNYNAELGALTPVWAALLPPDGPTGQFFSQKRVLEF